MCNNAGFVGFLQLEIVVFLQKEQHYNYILQCLNVANVFYSEGCQTDDTTTTNLAIESA